MAVSLSFFSPYCLLDLWFYRFLDLGLYFVRPRRKFQDGRAISYNQAGRQLPLLPFYDSSFVVGIRNCCRAQERKKVRKKLSSSSSILLKGFLFGSLPQLPFVYCVVYVCMLFEVLIRSCRQQRDQLRDFLKSAFGQHLKTLWSHYLQFSLPALGLKTEHHVATTYLTYTPRSSFFQHFIAILPSKWVTFI